jgi:acetolactate synthase I/II/III large subunit
MTDSGAGTGGGGLRTADIIGRRLFQAGVRMAFGIPGGEVLTLIDGLEKAGVSFLLSKHENAAGFMAEGAHHMTGTPGVLVATVGPGAANAVNVTANAQQDRVPLIVLTGCVDPADAVTYNHQVFDHRAVFGPICKASFTVPDGNVGAMIDKAIAIATEGRPGPVHLDVPIAIAVQVHEGSLPAPRVPRAPVAPANGPDLENARRWLAEAERPLVIAGIDAVVQNAGDAISEFAKAYGAPVIASYKAKGLIPDDEPMSLGGAGLSPLADKALMPLIKDADFILLAGYDPIEMRPGWRDPWDATDKRVVELLIEPEYSYMHQAPISFVCDIVEGIRSISAGVATRPTWSDGAPARARQTLAGAYGQNEAWGPAAITTTIRKVAPRDTVVTVDSGAHRILFSQVWETYVPHAVLQSTGLCTMGCALPLATGAKLAAPDRPVIAFTGDGGLEMVLGELVTLRDLKVPVVVVVFVDASLALIEKKQREMNYANAGVDMIETDFEALANVLGGHGVTVADRGALEAAMRDALRADTFTVIAAKIPRGSYDGRI